MTGGIGQSGGFDMFQQQQQQMGYSVNQSVISTGQQGYPSQQPGGMISGGGVIPVTALTNLGVAAEAVGQISELKQYLSRQVPHPVSCISTPPYLPSYDCRYTHHSM